jgi:hypothetical protein
VELTPEQREEARIVASDLAHLADRTVHRLDADVLRRESPILRRLLVEGQYQRAWRSVGLDGQPYVSAPGLDEMVGSVDRSFVQFAFAPVSETVRSSIANASGQMRLGVLEEVPAGSVAAIAPGYGQGFGLVFVVVPPDVVAADGDPDTVAERYFNDRLGRRLIRSLPLSKFIESPAAVILRTTITRGDIIKYAANKLGGAHFDPRREGEAGERLALLDRPIAELDFAAVENFTAIYAELLAIAEFVGESTDAAKFRDTVERLERKARKAQD